MRFALIAVLILFIVISRDYGWHHAPNSNSQAGTNLMVGLKNQRHAHEGSQSGITHGVLISPHKGGLVCSLKNLEIFLAPVT
jgi:hypothetical protein